MKNERGAGRKPVISTNELNIIRNRIDGGEKVSSIAQEYGISRQALYKRLKDEDKHDSALVLDHMVEGEVTTRIEVNMRNETIDIHNFGYRISRYAFGLNNNPSWDDFVDLLIKQLLRSDKEIEDKNNRFLVCESHTDSFTLIDVLGCSDNFQLVSKLEEDSIPSFTFTKKDILYSRTDTDGYQLKALSRNRQFFIKSQATISGELMNDWLVELMASDICEQLSIPCVKQYECDFVYGEQVYKGVYSRNFELDGYTFVSFESLLERMGTSSRTDEFVQLGAIDKMKWCASKLSEVGSIDYDRTLKYMMDLAVVDCLVGNIDRHTRNFGLLYNQHTCKYEIPLIFDNGMGLFENDGYRDRYTSYDAAMMHVYTAPYGEDPFDMYRMLDEEFDLHSIYPNLKTLVIDTSRVSSFAREYIERMKKLWQK